MKKLDKIIENINFKKAVTFYLILVVTFGILSTVFLGYKFKDKILFIYNFHNINEKVKENKKGINTITGDLKNLASSSSDIVDILILDNKNNIKSNFKNSEFSKEKYLELQNVENKKGKFLTMQSNNNIVFKLVKDDALMISKAFIDSENEVKRKYKDDYFFESDFSEKNVYFLSYLVDKESGDKVYFISDIKPIPNGKLYIKVVAAIYMLLLMVYWVMLA